MKLLRLIPILALGTILTACGGMPKECEESWKHMEDLAKLKFEFLFTGKNGCLQTEASIL